MDDHPSHLVDRDSPSSPDHVIHVEIDCRAGNSGIVIGSCERWNVFGGSPWGAV